jgi:hypothetical protein
VRNRHRATHLDGKTRITVRDTENRDQNITVDTLDYQAWVHGVKHVQDAFPYLDAGQRELLITGIAPDTWDRLVSTEDAELENDKQLEYDRADYERDPFLFVDKDDPDRSRGP